MCMILILYIFLTCTSPPLLCRVSSTLLTYVAIPASPPPYCYPFSVASSLMKSSSLAFSRDLDHPERDWECNHIHQGGMNSPSLLEFPPYNFNQSLPIHHWIFHCQEKWKRHSSKYFIMANCFQGINSRVLQLQQELYDIHTMVLML